MLVEAREEVLGKAREDVLVESKEEVLLEARKEVLLEAREELLLEARQKSCYSHSSESSSLYSTTWATKLLHYQKVVITKLNAFFLVKI